MVYSGEGGGGGQKGKGLRRVSFQICGVGCMWGGGGRGQEKFSDMWEWGVCMCVEEAEREVRF